MQRVSAPLEDRMAYQSFEWMSCVLTDLAAFAKENQLSESEQAFQVAIETVQAEVRRRFSKSEKPILRKSSTSRASSSPTGHAVPDRGQLQRLWIVASRD